MRALYTKLHLAIERFEQKCESWRTQNKPLFWILVSFFWIFTTIAGAALCDYGLPALGVGWVVRAILEISGTAIFIITFIFSIRGKKEKGILFWYPWSMVFCLAIGICFLFNHQARTAGRFRQTIADTNAFYSSLLSATNRFYQTSDSALIAQNTGLNQRVQDLKQEMETQKDDFNEAKREDDAKIQNLTTEKESAENRLAFFEANPERLMQIYSNLQAVMPTNVNQYFSMFSQFNMEVSNLDQIETTVQKYTKTTPESSDDISNQLANLGIHRLPDGHINFNGMISGSPTIVEHAFNEGLNYMGSGQTSNALMSFQKGIGALEASDISGNQLANGASYVSPDGKAVLYFAASYCAGFLKSNVLALSYAQKAVSINSGSKYRALITMAASSIAQDKLRENNLMGAFDSFEMAITNYESLSNPETNLLPTSIVFDIYNDGSIIAGSVGKTNEATAWLKKSTDLQFKQVSQK